MKRIGILLPVLCLCFALAAWSRVQAQPDYHQYKLYDLGTLGGPNTSTSYFGMSLSRKATIGGSQIAVHDPFDPNCLGDVYFPGCYVMHGFQWNNGVLADLGALGKKGNTNSSFASAVNDFGSISGYSENGIVDVNTGYPEAHAVEWKNGKIVDIGTFGGTQSAAMDINDSGQVVGGSLNNIDDPWSKVFVTGFGAVAYPGTTQMRAFLWQDGRKYDLGTLGGPDAFAYAINSFGQITGESYTNSTPNPTTGIPTVDPFLWTDGNMIDLGSLGGTIGWPVWLNERGQVVGFSNLAGDAVEHGFVWSQGKMNDLPPLSGGDNSWALWINDRGDVVGGSDLPGDQVFDATLWKAGSPIDLGVLGQDSCSEAWSINNLGQIVGISNYCGSAMRAFLWQNGSMVDLNLLLDKPSSLYLYLASYINDMGEIVAQGSLPSGDIHTVLLVPDGYCRGDCQQRIGAGEDTRQVRANASAMNRVFGDQTRWFHNHMKR